MPDKQERMHILDLIDQGKISAEEGLQLLEALATDESESAVELLPAVEEPPPGEAEQEEAAQFPEGKPPVEEFTILPAPQPTPKPEFAEKWRNWWQIPFWVGTAITVASAVWMTQALQGGKISWGFYLALIPFLFGVLVIVLAWQSRNAPWLHIRINEHKEGHSTRIALSFPLPIGPMRWFLRTFGDRIPNIRGTSLDEVMTALGQGTSKENPLYIRVEEEDGEQVEIYIG